MIYYDTINYFIKYIYYHWFTGTRLIEVAYAGRTPLT